MNSLDEYEHGQFLGRVARGLADGKLPRDAGAEGAPAERRELAGAAADLMLNGGPDAFVSLFHAAREVSVAEAPAMFAGACAEALADFGTTIDDVHAGADRVADGGGEAALTSYALALLAAAVDGEDRGPALGRFVGAVGAAVRRWGSVRVHTAEFAAGVFRETAGLRMGRALEATLGAGPEPTETDRTLLRLVRMVREWADEYLARSKRAGAVRDPREAEWRRRYELLTRAADAMEAGMPEPGRGDG